MTKPTTIEEVLDDLCPIEHEDGDYLTCDSLYYKCSYKGMKTSNGKTVRRFADGLCCIAKSYAGWQKECRHPKEFWVPGKCSCGALKARKQALATIEQLVLERVIGTTKEMFIVKGREEETYKHVQIREQLREEQRQALKQLLGKNSDAK